MYPPCSPTLLQICDANPKWSSGPDHTAFTPSVTNTADGKRLFRRGWVLSRGRHALRPHSVITDLAGSQWSSARIVGWKLETTHAERAFATEAVGPEALDGGRGAQAVVGDQQPEAEDGLGQ